MNRITVALSTAVITLALAWGQAWGVDLVDSFRKASKHDPAYLAASHEAMAQKALPKQSRSQLLPQIQGSYSYNTYDYREAPESYENYSGENFNINLRQPVFNAMKFVDLGQNKLRALSGELKLLDIRNNLMIRVSEAYFRHLHARDYLEQLGEEQKALEENLKMITKLSRAGEATLVDLHDAEARKAEVDFRVIEGSNQVEITRQDLERLLGERVDTIASLSDNLDTTSPPSESMDDWIRDVKEKNPAVRYYAMGADIARYEMRKQQAQRLPSVDFVGFFTNRNTNNDVQSPRLSYFGAGIQASMPLWTSGTITYKVQEYRERHAQSLKEYERVLSDALQAARAAFLGVRSSSSKVTSARAYLNASQTALASTKMGYQSGVRTAVDLLNATSSLYKAKAELLQVRIDYVMQKLKLLYWNGTLNEGSLAEINNYLIGRQQ